MPIVWPEAITETPIVNPPKGDIDNEHRIGLPHPQGNDDDIYVGGSGLDEIRRLTHVYQVPTDE